MAGEHGASISRLCKGNNDDTRDYSFTTQNVDLAPTGNHIIDSGFCYISQSPPLVCMILLITAATPVGVFIDDIEFTDCDVAAKLIPHEPR